MRIMFSMFLAACVWLMFFLKIEKKWIEGKYLPVHIFAQLEQFWYLKLQMIKMHVTSGALCFDAACYGSFVVKLGTNLWSDWRRWEEAPAFATSSSAALQERWGNWFPSLSCWRSAAQNPRWDLKELQTQVSIKEKKERWIYWLIETQALLHVQDGGTIDQLLHDMVCGQL